MRDRAAEPFGSVYRSAVDRWIAGIIVLSFAAGLFAVLALMRAGTAGDWIAAVFTVLVLAGTFSMMMPIRYLITDGALVIRSGLHRIRVPLDSIERVAPSRSLIASPALSMDRVSIRYRKDRFAASEVLISPEARDAFMREIAAAARLVEREGALVQPVERGS